MQLITDLHTHSKYSRATSPEMNLPSLWRWGKIKGINIIGTGDFTHPLWQESLVEQLEPAENGLYTLKQQYAKIEDEKLPENIQNNLIRFVCTAEISTIYKKKDKVRKLHTIIVSPNLNSVKKLTEKLKKIGNLHSDGRPILGLDNKELLKIVLDTDPDMLFIPAHIWTPWFSVFGSKSGFDSLEEAYDELTPYIYAVETGLSSDPAMNWRISDLDKVMLISNSDAHSPAKLGREATVLDIDLSYQEIAQALKTKDKRAVGTIEFFPEEGKYHYDGHRNCEIVLEPKESIKLNNICPKCGKELTLGVEHRVEELADRSLGFKPKQAKKVEYIVPLTELIAQTLHVSGTSKKVMKLYEEIISGLGDEFSILRKVTVQQIREQGYERLAEAIEAMRAGNVEKTPGYDGVFGTIKVRAKDNNQEQSSQQALFSKAT